MAYDPSQPRESAGTEIGGQWSSDGSVAGDAARSAAGLTTESPKGWTVIGRHKWVLGAVIAESYDKTEEYRRFTATIEGYRNWLIWEGLGRDVDTKEIVRKVKEIRDRIRSGDESVFQ